MASGPDRARLAAQQAVVCPLLEGVELSGARGVLVNITATRGSLKASETRTAMAEIRNYASPDAHVIFGTAFDETLGDQLRVTVVATGLNRASTSAKRDMQQPLTVIRTGTDNVPVGMVQAPQFATQSYEGLETPTVWRNPRAQAAAKVDALVQNGMDEIEIPAFLRKQAD
jgi:cell division protein FtsZ